MKIMALLPNFSDNFCLSMRPVLLVLNVLVAGLRLAQVFIELCPYADVDIPLIGIF